MGQVDMNGREPHSMALDVVTKKAHVTVMEQADIDIRCIVIIILHLYKNAGPLRLDLCVAKALSSLSLTLF
jgi:hypothetical protein